MKKIATLTLSLLLTCGLAFANSPKDSDAQPAVPAKPKAAKKAEKSESAIAAEIEELRQAMQAQQEQLQMLKEELAKRDRQIDEARDAAAAANARAAEASNKASEAITSSVKAESSTAALNTTVADLKASSEASAASSPAAQKSEPKLGPIASQDFKVGATFYGNFTHYTDAGFSPGFQDLPTTQLQPGNCCLNTFEITRGYINLFYTPDEHVTLRLTPDVYRASDQSLVLRMKYAFVDFQKIFGDGAFKKDKITFGETQQPLTDWEEGLSGYRYAYLTPWNYLSLSSTYVGAKIHGPIELNGKEYLDYDLGVFTTASFHSTETNDKKQIMGRVTVYPFGTTADRTGLGFTVFENYGYNTKPPSQVSTPLNRFSILAHYQTHDKAYQIAFEYQLGRNAVSTGNLFGGTGSPAGGPYDDFNTLAATVLSGTHTKQQGFDVFGHARLGHSPFSLWGLYQHFQPNTNYSGINPLDFAHTVGGISYKVTNHFDVAVGDQNFHWLHPTLGTPHGPDTNGIVIWTQFNY
ncbi:MAG: hypothetical protein WCE61_06305 [Candidatus Acidiferrum sp.]